MARLLYVLPLLLLVAACGNDASSRSGTASTATEPPEATIPFRIDGTLDFVRDGEAWLTLDIEIAESDSAKERGMMQRTSFPERTGMLFPFAQEQIRQFWMGNTPLALDLIFISADSHVVSFAKYARPYSEEPLVSSGPAQYVLEVPAGFVDTHGIIETDRVRWRRTEGQ